MSHGSVTSYSPRRIMHKIHKRGFCRDVTAALSQTNSTGSLEEGIQFLRICYGMSRMYWPYMHRGHRGWRWVTWGCWHGTYLQPHVDTWDCLLRKTHTWWSKHQPYPLLVWAINFQPPFLIRFQPSLHCHVVEPYLDPWNHHQAFFQASLAITIQASLVGKDKSGTSILQDIKMHKKF